MTTRLRPRGRPLAILGAMTGLLIGLGTAVTAAGVDTANAAASGDFTSLDLSRVFNADAFTPGANYTSGTVYPDHPPATFPDEEYGAVPMAVGTAGTDNVWLSQGGGYTASFKTSMSVNTRIANARALWVAGIDGGWVYDHPVPVDISYTVDGVTHTTTVHPNDWCTSGTGSDLSLWVAGTPCGDIAVARIDWPTSGRLTNVTVTDAATSAYAEASIPVFAITVYTGTGGGGGGGGGTGTVTYDPANAPPDTHVVTGTPSPGCVISGTTVICNSYELAGVGETDARASLTAYYSAVVDCYNHGANHNNPIESHETTFSDSRSSGWTASKNGRLYVEPLTASATAGELAAALYCPNPNWDAVMRPGTLTVTGYTYTLTFQGYSAPYIRITE